MASNASTPPESSALVSIFQRVLPLRVHPHELSIGGGRKEIAIPEAGENT